MILKNIFVAGALVLIVFALFLLLNKYFPQRKGIDEQLLDASKYGNVEVVEALISKGADVNARDENGATPLHYAIANEYKNIVYVLLKHGADFKIEDKDGIAPLHIAAYMYNEDYDNENNVIPLLLHTP